MPLDIQLDGATLRSLIRGFAQQKIGITCVPQTLGQYVDHVEIGDATMTVSPTRADFVFHARVFTTNDASLQANENIAPPGALTPALETPVTVVLSVAGTKLELNVESSLEQLQGLNPLGTLDLKILFGPGSLGLPLPSISTLEKVADTVMIRFDASSPATNHLQPGQLWCLFIDAGTFQIIVNTLLDTLHVKERLPGSVTVTTNWRPKGNLPHVDVSINGIHKDIPLGSIDLGLALGIDFGLDPQKAFLGVGILQQTISWGEPSVNVTGPVSILQSEIQDIATQLVDGALDPKAIGAVSIGPREIMREQALPELAFGPAKFLYRSILGTEAGMVLGGGVKGISPLMTFPLDFSISPFPDQFTKSLSCRSASTGSRLGIHVSASITMINTGKFCAWEVVSPSPSTGVAPYINVSPSPDTVTDDVSINVTLTVDVARTVLSFGSPIRILIRTANGVRLANLGSPELDENGNPKKVQIELVDDCVHNYAIDDWVLHFPGIFNPHWHVDGPPIWVDDFGKIAAFESSLIRIPQVLSGEVVSFIQPLGGKGPSVFAVTKNSQSVTVPTLTAVRNFDEGTVLKKIGSTGLGPLSIESKFFFRVAVLDKSGAKSHRISALSNVDRLAVIHHFSDREEVSQLDAQGLMFEVPTEEAKRHVSQTPLEDQEKVKKRWNPQPHVAHLHFVPGFEDAEVAVAELTDGSFCSLIRNEEGEIGVSGVLPAWPKVPKTSGPWAISDGADGRVAVFVVQPVKRFEAGNEML